MKDQKMNDPYLIDPSYKVEMKRTNRGRPNVFDNVEDLQDHIIDYFDHCVAYQKPPTLSGLARKIGVDRKTLYNYGKKDKFFPAIKRAKEFIEEFYESQLIEGKNVAGVIFNLVNNYGWQNKTVVDNKHDVKGQVTMFELPKNGKENN